MSIQYNAPKPRYTNWNWFKFIAIRIVFPPIVLWDLLKIAVNKLTGKTVGFFILPAQFFKSSNSDDNVSNYNTEGVTCTKYSVITHDNACLDTFECTNNSQSSTDFKYQKYIINFVGNGMRYENIITNMVHDANDLKANVVGFNYRGVSGSTGYCQASEDLVIDGIAQVQRLLDKGVSPQNIFLKGESLGGAIATLVAEHFHQLEQPINLFNSRSFSSITNILVANIHQTNGAVTAWLTKPFITFAMALSKWEINAGKAFKKIPRQYKDYIVVRSGKEIRNNSKDDTTIPHYASLYKELTSERRQEKAKIDKQIQSLGSNEQGLKDKLILTREKIKNDRKMQASPTTINGHAVDWDSLQNRSGTNAIQFFSAFIERADKDHGVNITPTNSG